MSTVLQHGLQGIFGVPHKIKKGEIVAHVKLNRAGEDDVAEFSEGKDENGSTCNVAVFNSSKAFSGSGWIKAEYANELQTGAGVVISRGEEANEQFYCIIRTFSREYELDGLCKFSFTATSHPLISAPAP